MPEYLKERRRVYEQIQRIASGPLSVEEMRHLDRELVLCGLVRLDDVGGAIVTPKGGQFVFQFDCTEALRQLLQDGAVPDDAQVLQWLATERFIQEPKHHGDPWEVTARGRSWLESLTPLPCRAPAD